MTSQAKQLCELLEDFIDTTQKCGTPMTAEACAKYLAASGVIIQQDGWWLDFVDEYRCVHCGKPQQNKTPYCPQCGATMRVRR